MKFNEDSRVKIPSLLHFTKLGYTYLSLKKARWDEDTNIFTDIFIDSICKINEDIDRDDATRLLSEITLMLDNEDLGKAFYKRLVDQSGTRLIDFDNFDNNTFNVVTELTYKKDDEEFRPDIILLINGMPLSFIEVKKPHNLGGIQEEHKRMARRNANKKFRRFINITQIMAFSNNMEYDNESHTQLQGAFYAAPSYGKPIFNYFREEEEFDKSSLLPLDSTTEDFILKDTNLVSIKNSKEYTTNNVPSTPTNRICTSLFHRERIKFILQYAVAYVKETSGLQKHLMRYPQIFATKAITAKLDDGIRKGIIWHTQGSGKTALAYYNVKHLTNYFKSKGIIPKFYFIVDRLDLLIQAGKEFRARDLVVHNVQSKTEFATAIKSNKAIENDKGDPEITVVNIHKFQNDDRVAAPTDYNLGIQRIYFLDEVHRSYNPKGSFLANLRESDPNSIKIGLTGTPLLGTDVNSKMLFGGYIHKYYYNQSIADNYTLRLIREEIETSYKVSLNKILAELQIKQGDADRKFIYSHARFVEPMLDYIVQNLKDGRISLGDETIGGMVICDSSEQAKEMQTIFEAKYANKETSAMLNEPKVVSMAAEPKSSYGSQKATERKVNSSAIILHDIGTKKEREDWVQDFKDGKIDILFVYNMLLTGFDAKRLKKLYIGRVIKAHNLLQALTRVNRTYKNHRFGYVVDFADISKEFDKTNKDYFDELQSELGDEMESYSNLFLSPEEINTKIGEIKDALFKFDTANAEIFSNQVAEIGDRKTMLQLTRALNEAKSLYNLIRLSGNYDLLEKLDFKKLGILSRVAQDRLNLINAKENLENANTSENILNVALEEVFFAFTKVKEEEMQLAENLQDALRRTREVLGGNFDPKDPVFISLKAELERLFKKKNLSEVTKEDMEANIIALDSIYARAKELERENKLLKAKYEYDAKYARLHKRMMERELLSGKEQLIFGVLNKLKEEADVHILQNSKMLDNESFVNKMIGRLIATQVRQTDGLSLSLPEMQEINHLVVKEYMNEYHGRIA
ncbi:DEAD/DEAH box helicase family protein [Bacteroidia bacterium]|nr:DEAD/DEAH box helicase family protein [Bacteroidia bacterium]